MKLNSLECEDPDCENEIVGTEEESFNNVIWTAKDLGWETDEEGELWWCPPHKKDKRHSGGFHWKCTECYEHGFSRDQEALDADVKWHQEEDCEYRDPNVDTFTIFEWRAYQEEQDERQKKFQQERLDRAERERQAEVEKEKARRRELDLIDKGKRYERIWWVRLMETLGKGKHYG